MNLLNTFRQVGVTAEMSAIDKKYIRLTTFLNLATIFIIAIPALLVINYSPFPYKGQASLIRFELLIPFSLFNLYLNWRGSHLLSKILTILTPYVFIFILPLFNRYMHAGMLLWMPYGILIMGTYPFSLFSLFKKGEHTLLIAMALLFGISCAFYDNIFILLDHTGLEISFIKEFYIVYKLTLIAFPVLLYFNLYLLKERNYKIQEQLDQKNELLLKMNESLEQQVMERTARIQNVAHTNSHLIRATTCRILGLSSLLEITDDKEEIDFCIKSIVVSVKEMDMVTKELSYTLAG